MFAVVKAKVLAWLKNVIGEAISSKKFVVMVIGVVVAITVLRSPKAAIALAAFWMACQTAVDIIKIYKDKK